MTALRRASRQRGAGQVVLLQRLCLHQRAANDPALAALGCPGAVARWPVPLPPADGALSAGTFALCSRVQPHGRARYPPPHVEEARHGPLSLLSGRTWELQVWMPLASLSSLWSRPPPHPPRPYRPHIPTCTHHGRIGRTSLLALPQHPIHDTEGLGAGRRVRLHPAPLYLFRLFSLPSLPHDPLDAAASGAPR